MRVVVDTVVLVRGLMAPQSWWGRLLFDNAERYEFVVSADIVAEYLEVLSRPRIAGKLRPVATRDFPAVLDIVAKATVVQPDATPSICRDPADDKFIAAAKAGAVAFMVSEDLDLLDLGSYEGIPIITAEAFLHILEERDRAET